MRLVYSVQRLQDRSYTPCKVLQFTRCIARNTTCANNKMSWFIKYSNDPNPLQLSIVLAQLVLRRTLIEKPFHILSHKSNH